MLICFHTVWSRSAGHNDLNFAAFTLTPLSVTRFWHFEEASFYIVTYS